MAQTSPGGGGGDHCEDGRTRHHSPGDFVPLALLGPRMFRTMRLGHHPPGSPAQKVGGGTRPGHLFTDPATTSIGKAARDLATRTPVRLSSYPEPQRGFRGTRGGRTPETLHHNPTVHPTSAFCAGLGPNNAG